MIQLTKSLFVKGVDCPRRAWLLAHRKDLKPEETEADKMRAQMGRRLGELARGLYPNAFLCYQPGMVQEDAVAMTQAAIEDGQTALAEASFEHEGLFARTDLLEFYEDSAFVWEVKSSAAYKDHHILDLAFQWQVLELCGINVVGAGLILIDNTMVWDGGMVDPEKLFRREVVTDLVRKQLDSAALQSLLILKALNDPEAEAASRKKVCRDCDFIDHCYGHLTSDDILFLGFAKDEEIRGWEAQGITKITEIPDGDLKRKDQRQLKELLSTDGLSFAEDLSEALDAIKLPACFVDFETDSTAIPWLEGSRPYQAVPFQQSIVMLHSWQGPETSNEEFLWDPEMGPDPRPLFVKSLLKPFEEAATIIHYSSAEMTQLKKLAEQEVEGADNALSLLAEKGVDLEKIVKGRVKHRDLGTRTTIKKVLPLLCPEMSGAYGEMEVGDGDAAMAAFQRLRSGRLVKEEADRLRNALLKYCHLDSWAMVAVAISLRKHAGL